jgi:hypothetical protein
MSLDTAGVRKIVERACARPDVLDACRRRDLGLVIEVLGSHGVTANMVNTRFFDGITQTRICKLAFVVCDKHEVTGALGVSQHLRVFLAVPAYCVDIADLMAYKDVSQRPCQLGSPRRGAEAIHVQSKVDCVSSCVGRYRRVVFGHSLRRHTLGDEPSDQVVRHAGAGYYRESALSIWVYHDVRAWLEEIGNKHARTRREWLEHLGDVDCKELLMARMFAEVDSPVQNKLDVPCRVADDRISRKVLSVPQIAKIADSRSDSL